MTYSERTCPVCGNRFSPKHPRAIYDTPACRVRAVRARQKVARLAPEYKAMLDIVRGRYPLAAAMFENDFANHFDQHCLQAILRFAILLTSEVKNGHKTSSVELAYETPGV